MIELSKVLNHMFALVYGFLANHGAKQLCAGCAINGSDGTVSTEFNESVMRLRARAIPMRGVMFLVAQGDLGKGRRRDGFGRHRPSLMVAPSVPSGK